MAPSSPSPGTQPATKPRGHKSLFFILMVILIGIAVIGIVSRIHATSSLQKATYANAVPKVTVMQAPEGPTEEEIVLPGTVQAWHESPVYARTNGYLRSWLTDIGTPVKAGDLLADIDTPEVDAQLQQAEADLHTAEANSQLAQSTAIRWQKLLKTNSVSQQEADEKTSTAAAQLAMVASAKANLDRLRQLEDFKRVVAPFDGIITARNTDIGALINAGNAGAAQELFRIADTSKLRIYVQVPQINSLSVKPGMTAELHFVEYPQQIFPAKLTRTANALTPGTRTLLVEFEVDNDSGVLMPGGYTEVHIKLPTSANSVHLPINTLLFNTNGSQIATIDEQSRAVLKTIKIGRDYGKQVEVIDGVTPGETIIVNPPDSLATGDLIKVITPDDKDKEASDNKHVKKDDKKDDKTESDKSNNKKDDNIKDNDTKDDTKDAKKP